ncbi:hypothetical protein [Robertkochia sediminum]|uniref:hypothetical protein n=1 Tax=Robertkochia sediminum TaxID=2785326 RepID=UPI001933662E|nr:hypothetical protein [Robertkochia sediminum]MBL7472905.1 hypothetical protein [Robertkochia sediminum]
MKNIWFLALLLAVFVNIQAQELRPYTLGTAGDQSVAVTKTAVVDALNAQGLKVVGTYDNVHADAAIVVFTAEELLRSVQQVGELRGLAATLRVAITKEGGKSVVSYTTPEYWGTAYFRDNYSKVKSNYDALAKKLVNAMSAIGDYNGKAFGSEKGLDAKKLKSYRYMFGMPKFDDVVELGEFASHQAAVDHIDAAVKNGVSGLTQVYKVAIPNTDLVVYGFGMIDADGEKNFMPKIDIGDHKHTAFLPYELLVNGKEVVMLHGRYRIALSFPDLTMGTFTKIMSTPGYIEDTLKKVVE